jgi:hypothetical protein
LRVNSRRINGLRPQPARRQHVTETLSNGFESRRPRQLQLPTSNTPIPKQDFLGVWDLGVETFSSPVDAANYVALKQGFSHPLLSRLHHVSTPDTRARLFQQPNRALNGRRA